MTDELETIVKNAMNSNLTGTTAGQPYASIEEYTNITGKRFRMTKEQKDRGITREQAFQEFLSSKTQPVTE